MPTPFGIRRGRSLRYGLGAPHLRCGRLPRPAACGGRFRGAQPGDAPAPPRRYFCLVESVGYLTSDVREEGDGSSSRAWTGDRWFAGRRLWTGARSPTGGRQHAAAAFLSECHHVPGYQVLRPKARGRRRPYLKSASRDRTEGFVDRAAGRILEAFSKLTGRRSAGAKGKAARARGSTRGAKGRAKEHK